MANLLMSDNTLAPLFAPISDLEGAGPKLTAYLTALVGGAQLLDLVLFAPRKWVERRHLESLTQEDIGTDVIITGVVTKIESPSRPSAPYRIKLDLADGEEVSCVYFRADRKWLSTQFPENMWRSLSGKLEHFRDQFQIMHPDKTGAPEEAKTWPLSEPIYGQTANLSQKRIQNFVRQAVERVPTDLAEWIDAPLLKQRSWPSFTNALRMIHGVTPTDEAGREAAKLRLAYDEALFRGRILAQAQAARAKLEAEIYPKPVALETKLLKGLPFTPTGAQTRAGHTIAKDLQSGKPMRRLVQGDVGSGKTLVAAFAALQVLAGKGQVAFMAPTEILARQQYETLTGYFSPLGFECALLTGKDSAAKRNATKMGMMDGNINMVVGTQALFQSSVEFAKLDLIIIDELHRFGVSDREKLRQKGHMPHILVMSATPIPRSIAQMLHGDLDVTILDEKPAGRQDIDTRLLSDQKMPDIIAAIGRALARGEQAYWVCPRLDTDQEMPSAVARAQSLRETLGVDVSLVHGKLPSDEKQAALRDFRAGKTRLLTATSVIEVGVDVPNATIMVIESANNFGLAQLHQLRGRVGRGSAQSYCLLLYTPPLTESGRERLEILRQSNDGFEIAEKDFAMRGPGDVLGVKQSGDTPLRFLDPHAHSDLVMIAHKQAQYEVSRKLGGRMDTFKGQDALKVIFGARVKPEERA